LEDVPIAILELLEELLLQSLNTTNILGEDEPFLHLREEKECTEELPANQPAPAQLCRQAPVS